MSKIGAMRIFLQGVFEEARSYGLVHIDRILDTGILTKETNRGHAAKLYSWLEFRGLLERHGAEIVAASAANYLTTHGKAAQIIEGLWEREPKLWDRLLEWELRVCAEPGNLDGGTHIIGVALRRAAPRC